jgi:phage tail tube protein FII
MAFRFSIVSDVREVVRGNEAMEQGFEDTADSLDELARTAQQKGRQVEQALDRVGDEADDASTKLERKFRDAFREVESGAKKAGDEVGDRLRDGSRKAEDSADRVGDAFKDAGDEVGQSARESAASFSGEIGDVADLAQETLANAFASFGPLGAGAGIAAAAGLGALWTSISDNAESSKQIVENMYEAMKEAGAAYVGEDYVRQAADDIIQGADTAIVSMDRVRETVEATGLSAGTVIRAYAGDAEAMAQVLGTAADKQRELQDEASAANTSQIAQLQDVRDSFDGTNEKLDAAREKYDSWNQVVEAAPTEKVLDMKVNDDPARIGMGNFYRDVEARAAAGVTIPVDADTSDAERKVDALIRRAREANGIQQPV